MVLGPILSLVIFRTFLSLMFFVSAFLFILAAIIFALKGSEHAKKIVASPTPAHILPPNDIKIYLQIVASASIWFGVAVFETLVPIFIENVPRMPAFGVLLSLNGIVVIVANILIVGLLPKSRWKQSAFGFIGFAVAFAVLGTSL